MEKDTKSKAQATPEDGKGSRQPTDEETEPGTEKDEEPDEETAAFPCHACRKRITTKNARLQVVCSGVTDGCEYSQYVHVKCRYRGSPECPECKVGLFSCAFTAGDGKQLSVEEVQEATKKHGRYTQSLRTRASNAPAKAAAKKSAEEIVMRKSYWNTFCELLGFKGVGRRAYEKGADAVILQNTGDAVIASRGLLLDVFGKHHALQTVVAFHGSGKKKRPTSLRATITAPAEYRCWEAGREESGVLAGSFGDYYRAMSVWDVLSYDDYQLYKTWIHGPGYNAGRSSH